jgi:hypothetical protein
MAKFCYKVLSQADLSLHASPRQFNLRRKLVRTFAPNFYKRSTGFLRILLSAAVESSYPPSGKNYNDMVFGQPLKTHSVAVTSWEAQTGTVNWSTEIKSSDILEIGFSHSQDFVLVAAQDRIRTLAS